MSRRPVGQMKGGPQTQIPTHWIKRAAPCTKGKACSASFLTGGLIGPPSSSEFRGGLFSGYFPIGTMSCSRIGGCQRRVPWRHLFKNLESFPDTPLLSHLVLLERLGSACSVGEISTGC